MGPYHADIFQNGNFKYFQVATTPPPPPIPSDFDGLPYPRVRGTPDFFHQNGCKGCKRDYLDARGHFVSRFGATGDKPLEGVVPLRRRGLKRTNLKTKAVLQKRHNLLQGSQISAV